MTDQQTNRPTDIRILRAPVELKTITWKHLNHLLGVFKHLNIFLGIKIVSEIAVGGGVSKFQMKSVFVFFRHLPFGEKIFHFN